MKLCNWNLVIGLSAFCVVPFAQAADALSPEQHGALQAAMQFCAKVDPGNREKYGALAESYIHGLSEQSLDKIRKDPEYLSAFQVVGNVLQEMPKSLAVTDCTAAIPHVQHLEVHPRREEK